jgi:predicted nucleic acid-binding protein
MRTFAGRLPELSITVEVWEEACRLADRCRNSGETVPPHDILIAACACHHGVEIEHGDAHFDLLVAL